MRRLLLFTVVACLLAPCAATAAPYTPPPGKVFHSGIGGWARRRPGVRAAVR